MPAVLVTFLISIVGSIVGRVLASLGLSVVTIRGVDKAIGLLRGNLVNAVNALPSDMLNIFLMAGGGIAVNLMFAAITFRISYWGITKVVRIVGVTT